MATLQKEEIGEGSPCEIKALQSNNCCDRGFLRFQQKLTFVYEMIVTEDVQELLFMVKGCFVFYQECKAHYFMG